MAAMKKFFSLKCKISTLAVIYAGVVVTMYLGIYLANGKAGLQLLGLCAAVGAGVIWLVWQEERRKAKLNNIFEQETILRGLENLGEEERRKQLASIVNNLIKQERHHDVVNLLNKVIKADPEDDWALGLLTAIKLMSLCGEIKVEQANQDARFQEEMRIPEESLS